MALIRWPMGGGFGWLGGGCCTVKINVVVIVSIFSFLERERERKRIGLRPASWLVSLDSKP